NDGCYLSIQAGVNYGCFPCEDMETFDYDAVELYCSDLTDQDKDILSWYKSHSDNSMYLHVPVVLIDSLIEKHGGINTNSIDKVIEEHKNDKGGH
ncbi:MAG: hypothetical protein J6A59_03490, partial [Lachnospiraceae bacterium]|nr:hypothetical protein [Lachnospiraceae bacterium]